MTNRVRNILNRSAASLALAFIYAWAGWLMRLPGLMEGATAYATPVWPSAGIALGALLVRGRQLWPGVWLGSFLTDFPALIGGHAAMAAFAGAAVMATGTTLEALLGFALIRRFVGDAPQLDSAPDTLRFFVLGGPLATLVGSGIGTATIYFLGEKSVLDVAIDWLSWWSGDTIGVFLVTPIILALGGNPASLWRARLLTVALPLLVALGLVAAALGIVNHLEQGNRRAEFEQNANRIFFAVRDALLRVEEDAWSMIDLFRASRQVERGEFDLFAGGIQGRHPALQALEWVPRVARDRLAEHERATRAEGFPVYAVTERSASGRRMPAADREEYFPVQFAYPHAGNEAAIGYDLGSETIRRQALETARRAARLAVSGRVSLVQETGRQHGVLVFAPYFRPGPGAATDGLAGYTLVVVRVGQLIEALAQSLPRENVGYRIEDMDAAPAERLLHQSGDFGGRSLYRYARVIEFGGRSWQLSVVAAGGYQFIHRAWYAWASLVSAVSLSALLSLFLLVMSGRTLRVERMVAERTAELETARAVAEKTNQLLNEAVSSIEQGFTIYDENDRLVVCNDAYRRIYAASADLIVPGNTFEEIVRRGAERGQYREALGNIDAWVAGRVIQHQNARGEVIEQRLGDGRWLLIVEHRTPSGFIVGNRIDITELKRTAAALEERNSQLDAIFQLTPDGLVSFDHLGCVKNVNAAFERMTGLKAAEMLGQSQCGLESRLRELADNPGQWPGLDPCFAKVGAGGTAPGDARHLLSLRRPHAAVLDLLGFHGESASFGRLLYLHDVTHEVEVDRMKSEFLSHAAHELRTPMASIFGFSELLMSQEFDAATRNDLLATIHKQTSWLIEIINELLDLSRIEARRGKDFNIEAVALAPLMDEAVTAMKIDPERWPVRIDLPAGLPALMADAAKLRQVVTNVLGNAVKYSPAGGPIAIHAVERRIKGREQVGIVVADRGIGMTPEQAERVSERFYRADTSGNIPGTGLGMAIVKEVVELLGGQLEIASALGIGTSVTLWLPAGKLGGQSESSKETGERNRRNAT